MGLVTEDETTIKSTNTPIIRREEEKPAEVPYRRDTIPKRTALYENRDDARSACNGFVGVLCLGDGTCRQMKCSVGPHAFLISGAARWSTGERQDPSRHPSSPPFGALQRLAVRAHVPLVDAPAPGSRFGIRQGIRGKRTSAAIHTYQRR